MDQTLLSRYENNERDPRFNHMERVVIAMGYRLDDLSRTPVLSHVDEIPDAWGPGDHAPPLAPG